MTLCLRPLIAMLLAAGCGGDSPPERPRSTAPAAVQAAAPDSARQAFLREVDRLLLDTLIHEIKSDLSIKIRNTNPNDPESPLSDQQLQHPAGVGPHTYLGAVHAELGALRAALGDSLPIAVEDDRVFIGRRPRELLIIGHRHGDQLFVPVKLFARAYGAYVRVACPLANCATIWPREILDFMRRAGYTASAGVLEGAIEGLVDGVDVRKLPTG